MIYQLPNGRIIRISLEQYLDMTDDDIKQLCNPANNYGTFTVSPWTGSAIKKKQKGELKDDASIDYVPEEEEVVTPQFVSIDEEFSDELPDEEDDSNLD